MPSSPDRAAHSLTAASPAPYSETFGGSLPRIGAGGAPPPVTLPPRAGGAVPGMQRGRGGPSTLPKARLSAMFDASAAAGGLPSNQQQQQQQQQSLQVGAQAVGPAVEFQFVSGGAGSGGGGGAVTSGEPAGGAVAPGRVRPRATAHGRVQGARSGDAGFGADAGSALSDRVR